MRKTRVLKTLVVLEDAAVTSLAVTHGRKNHGSRLRARH